MLKEIKFDTLYSLDKNRKVRIFEVSLLIDTVLDIDHINNTNLGFLNSIDSNIDSFSIKTTTGLLRGKGTDRVKAVQAKSNRTRLQQAVLEINSLISDKKDEGYKSEDTFRMWAKTTYPDHYYERITLEDILKKVSYNTNSNWDELPMLAHKFDEKKKGIKFPQLIQRKYDGVRCIAKLTPDGIKMISRGGKYYDLPHIKEQLHKIFKEVVDDTSLIFDGELYSHSITFEKISGMCRREEKDLFNLEEEKVLEYHIYDIISDRNQLLRSKWLKELIEIVEEFPFPNIKIVETKAVYDIETVYKYHDQFVEEGYEGAILRDPEGKYEVGFRSNSLLKVKKFHEDEFQVVGFKTDDRFERIEESFVFELITKKGDKFYCKPKGSLELRKEYLKNIDSIIGKLATVKYLDTTNTGLPGKAHVKCIRNYE